MAKFGRAGHAISWATGPRRVRLGRESRALVSVANVWKWQLLVARV